MFVLFLCILDCSTHIHSSVCGVKMTKCVMVPSCVVSSCDPCWYRARGTRHDSDVLMCVNDFTVPESDVVDLLVGFGAVYPVVTTVGIRMWDTIIRSPGIGTVDALRDSCVD